MSRSTIIRVFLGSLAALGIGIGVVLASVIAVLATGDWVVHETADPATFHPPPRRCGSSDSP